MKRWTTSLIFGIGFIVGLIDGATHLPWYVYVLLSYVGITISDAIQNREVER